MTDGRPDVSAFDADEQARRAYQQGRLDGFSEARDAVEDTAPGWHRVHGDTPMGIGCAICDALAAIDALKGENS